MKIQNLHPAADMQYGERGIYIDNTMYLVLCTYDPSLDTRY